MYTHTHTLWVKKHVEKEREKKMDSHELETRMEHKQMGVLCEISMSSFVIVYEYVECILYKL